jgi:hypothetical protein
MEVYHWQTIIVVITLFMENLQLLLVLRHMEVEEVQDIVVIIRVVPPVVVVVAERMLDHPMEEVQR